MRPRLLIADDDRTIRDSLARALRLEGYDAVTVPDGVEAERELCVGGYDAAIVDVLMPGCSGLHVCAARRRAADETPILVLSALVRTVDRVAGLDAGADDYLIKPFELDELLARVRALVRRGRAAKASVCDLHLDHARRVASRAGREVTFTKTEFDVLELLVQRAGEVLSRREIYLAVWNYEFSARSRNLAMYISYVRSKLEQLGLVDVIETVRGVGYRLRASRDGRPDAAGSSDGVGLVVGMGESDERREVDRVVSHQHGAEPEGDELARREGQAQDEDQDLGQM